MIDIEKHTNTYENDKCPRRNECEFQVTFACYEATEKIYKYETSETFPYAKCSSTNIRITYVSKSE